MQCETALPALAPSFSAEAFCPGEGMQASGPVPTLDRARDRIRGCALTEREISFVPFSLPTSGGKNPPRVATDTKN